MRRIRTDATGASRRAFLTALAAAALVPAVADASPIVLPARRRVAAVRVRHLSDELDSALAIGAGEFAGRPDARAHTFVSAGAVTGAMTAIAASRPVDKRGVFPDVRWSLTLVDAHRTTLFVVYADRFVLNGAAGAAGVTFENGAPLAAWLHAHDPLK